MSTTDELLEEMLEDVEEYATPVTDDDLQFWIDEHLRVISIPKNGVVAGVEGDKNVNKIKFGMNRYYHGFDMSTFSGRILYSNAKGNKNYYNITDMQASGSTITFSWLVDADAVQYMGKTAFVVYLFKTQGSELRQKFYSTLATLKVLEGMEVDSAVPVEKQTDIIERMKEEISAYAEEVKKSLPADYTAMTEQVNSLKEDLGNSVDGILNGARINTIKLDDLEVWEQGVIWSSGTNGGENRDITFGIRTKDFISVNKSGFYEFTIKKMWKLMAIVYNQNYVFESAFNVGGTIYSDYTTQKEFSQEKKYKFYITKSTDSGSTDTSYAATINDCVNVTNGVLIENCELNYIPKIVKKYIDETNDEKKSILLKHTIADWEYGAINGGNGLNSDSTEYIRTGYIVFDVTSKILVEVSSNYRAVIFKYSNSGAFEEIVVAISGSTLNNGYAEFTPIAEKKYRISLRKQTGTAADLMWGRNVSLYYNEDVLDDSNKELIVATYAKRMKVCYYGDSIFAKGNGDDENYNNSWQKSVDDYFGFRHIGVGVGGSGYLWDDSRKMTIPDNFQNGDNLSSSIVVSSNGIMQSAFCSWDRITSTIPRDSDIVIIGTGTNDYGPEVFPSDDSDISFLASNKTDEAWGTSEFYAKYNGDYNLTKRRGAILSTIMKVQVWCPNAMIILTNFPNSRLSNGTGLNATETQKMEYQQPILNAIEFVHKWWGIPLIDFMSSCRINPLNRAEYCADGIHQNGKGYKLLGSVAIGVLKNLIN